MYICVCACDTYIIYEHHSSISRKRSPFQQILSDIPPLHLLDPLEHPACCIYEGSFIQSVLGILIKFTLSPTSMEVENYPNVQEFAVILEEPIFHWTMIAGGITCSIRLVFDFSGDFAWDTWKTPRGHFFLGMDVPKSLYFWSRNELFTNEPSFLGDP